VSESRGIADPLYGYKWSMYCRLCEEPMSEEWRKDIARNESNAAKRYVCKNCRMARSSAHPWVAVAERFFAKSAMPMARVAAALEIAHAEGRLDDEIAEYAGVDTGQFTCLVCGMSAWTSDDADACCAPLEPGVPSIREGASWS
jgi:hypothetical protein